MELMPYQRQAVDFGVKSKLPGLIIADEMGLGKTVEAIRIAVESGSRRVLVVCPALLKINWAREWQMWTEDWFIKIAYGDELKAFSGAPKGDGNLAVICNYDILERHLKLFRSVSWDTIIADEAHYIKNPESKRGRFFVGEIKLKFKKALLLTGTPIENRPIELQTLLQFIGVPWAQSRTDFGIKYCAGFQYSIPCGRNKDGSLRRKLMCVFSGASNLAELKQSLKFLVIRRTKKQVLKDLPDKVRKVVELEATPRMKALIAQEYDLLENIRAEADAALIDVTYLEILESMTPDDPLFEQISAVRREQAIEKVSQVAAYVELLLNTKDKIVVFAHHHELIEGLEAALRIQGIDALTLYGKTRHQQQVVDDFKDLPCFRVLVTSIKEGQTLTVCDTAVMAELDWKPSTLLQREDRLHRIGQKNTCFYHYLVVDGSLDITLAKAVARKTKIIKEIFS